MTILAQMGHYEHFFVESTEFNCMQAGLLEGVAFKKYCQLTYSSRAALCSLEDRNYKHANKFYSSDDLICIESIYIWEES